MKKPFDEEQLRAEAKALFDDSVERLDAATLSRLNQGRQKALQEISAGAPAGQWARWVPAGGLAAPGGKGGNVPGLHGVSPVGGERRWGGRGLDQRSRSEVGVVGGRSYLVGRFRAAGLLPGRPAAIFVAAKETQLSR